MWIWHAKVASLVLVSIGLLCACGQKAPTHQSPSEVEDEPSAILDGPDSAKTVDEIKAQLPFGEGWKTHEIGTMKLLLGKSVWPSDGESYINVHGYVFYARFNEWRRVCLVTLRGVFNSEIKVSSEEGVFFVLDTTNGKDRRVFQLALDRIDLGFDLGSQ